jgi:PAS domain S-box-containing protein
VNKNYCEISGYPAAELLGRDHRIINSGYHPQSFINYLWKTIADGKIWRGEFCNKAKDGTLYWVDATIVPFLNDRGKPVQYIEISIDITDKKLMAQKILEQKIEEQKKIARAIINAQEKERNHIGQELHDNINQILVSIKMHLSMAGKDEKLKELIKYPMELLNNSIHEIRLLSSTLVTPLKNINLKDLIQQLLDELGKNHSIETDFVYNLSDLLISDDLKLNIFRTIQEQLNNIAKHAAAKKVTITVLKIDNILRVVVADDGKGFDVNNKRKGIGISNMINRIESFNGDVAIESFPGSGCRIVIKVPY